MSSSTSKTYHLLLPRNRDRRNGKPSSYQRARNTLWLSAGTEKRSHLLKWRLLLSYWSWAGLGKCKFYCLRLRSRNRGWLTPQYVHLLYLRTWSNWVYIELWLCRLWITNTFSFLVSTLSAFDLSLLSLVTDLLNMGSPENKTPARATETIEDILWASQLDPYPCTSQPYYSYLTAPNQRQNWSARRVRHFRPIEPKPATFPHFPKNA